MKQTKRSGSFTVNAILASCVLYYVLKLSASGRTAIDWTVIGLVVGAILYNIVQLSRRLHQAGCANAIWRVQRTVFFWAMGLLNTILLRPEHVEGWRNWLGWGFLAIAAADTIALSIKERASLVAAEGPPATDSDSR